MKINLFNKPKSLEEQLDEFYPPQVSDTIAEADEIIRRLDDGERKLKDDAKHLFFTIMTKDISLADGFAQAMSSYMLEKKKQYSEINSDTISKEDWQDFHNINLQAASNRVWIWHSKALTHDMYEPGDNYQGKLNALKEQLEQEQSLRQNAEAAASRGATAEEDLKKANMQINELLIAHDKLLKYGKHVIGSKFEQEAEEFSRDDIWTDAGMSTTEEVSKGDNEKDE